MRFIEFAARTLTAALVAVSTAAVEPALATQRGARSTGEMVRVWKDLGRLQCEPSAGRRLEGLVAELATQSIEASPLGCFDDGMARPAVCGAGTGEVGVVAVRPRDVGQAEKLGFRRLDGKTKQVALGKCSR